MRLLYCELGCWSNWVRWGQFTYRGGHIDLGSVQYCVGLIWHS